jgi:hypothetical protein
MAGSYVGEELTSEVLKTISKSQEAMVDAIETWAATLSSIKPELPAVTMPFADKLPAPSDVVASAYDFAAQLLAGQRKFAEDLLRATAPLLPSGTGKASAEASPAT